MTSLDRATLSELLDAVRSGWRVVLGVWLATLVLLVVVTLLSRVTFQATGRLFLGARATAADVERDLEILRSHTSLTRAILASGLNVELTKPGERPLRYWRWRLSGRDPANLDTALAEARAVEARLPDTAREPHSFELRFKTATEYDVLADAKVLGRGTIERPFQHAALTVTVTKGTAGAPSAGSTYQLTVHPLSTVADEVQRELRTTRLGATSRRDPMQVLSLELTWPSPSTGAAFVRELMTGLVRQRQAWSSEHASAAEQFLSQQLDVIRQLLDRAESDLVAVRTNDNAVSVDDATGRLVNALATTEEQRASLRLEIVALSAAQAALQRREEPPAAQLMGEIRDPVLEHLAADLTREQHALTTLRARYHDDAPAVIEQRARVDALVDDVAGYVSGRLERARANLAALESVRTNLDAQLAGVPETQRRLTTATRDTEVYRRTYAYLLKRQQDTALTRAASSSGVRIVDMPAPALQENHPRLPLRPTSLLLGLLLGLSMVVGRRAWGRTVQSPGDATRLAAPHSVLGAVPKLGIRRWLARRASADAPLVVDGPSAEAFRAVRAGLYRLTEGRSAGAVVTVTSPGSGDGKSLCATALATALATDEQRVLLLELTSGESADSPSLPLGSLRQSLGWDELTGVGPASSRGFSTLRANADDPVSPGLGLFAEARARFDFIIVDETSTTRDAAALLARESDVVLEVLRCHHTSRRRAREHLDELSEHAAVIAVLVNDVRIARPLALRRKDVRSRSSALGALVRTASSG